MHFLKASTFSLAIAVVTAASPSRYVLHEKRNVMPFGWDKSTTSQIRKHDLMPMRIGLTQNNLDLGDEKLMAIADPDSPSYGQHWTDQEIVDFFAPSFETVSAVKDWVTAAGIRADRIKQAGNKGWIEFEATVTEVEKLLQTEYGLYEHADGSLHYACQEYSVPSHVQQHIDIITPTLHFDIQTEHPDHPNLKKRAAPPNTGGMWGGPKTGPSKPDRAAIESPADTCGSYITPACLRALYKMPYGTKNLSSFGVVEYSPNTVLADDVTLFEQYYGSGDKGSYIEDWTIPIDAIDGGYLDTKDYNYNTEADLDIEYALDLVYPQTITLMQVGDHGKNYQKISFNNFLDGIDASYCTYEGGDDPNQDEKFPDTGTGAWTKKEQCGVWTPPAVISTSYGYDEHGLTPAYEQRQCNEYMKLGLKGVSFLYSSGDYGVAGNGGQCINADGSFNSGGKGIFNPAFPSTCPYVTSVGATQIPTGGSATTAETACETVIYSGGGFSNVFPIPSYQSSAVATYFKNHKPAYTAKQYNNSQTVRGYPDVAANGANYACVVDLESTLVYGTSAAAPTFASLITLINNERKAKGKAPLGFLNPIFYKNPTMFNDIVKGGNQGCGTKGFTAVAGWDPVTGLGTPNYTKMLTVLLAA